MACDLAAGRIATSLLTPANMASQDSFCALFVSISQHCIETEINLFNLVHRGDRGADGRFSPQELAAPPGKFMSCIELRDAMTL